MNKQLEAVMAGLVRYSSGRPCKRGHNSPRYASSGTCCECMAERAEAHRVAIKTAYDKPMARPGLISYRYPDRHGGWIMIGAKDNAHALKEARRRRDNVVYEKLEIWTGCEYILA